jgi:hypothetical protein
VPMPGAGLGQTLSFGVTCDSPACTCHRGVGRQCLWASRKAERRTGQAGGGVEARPQHQDAPVQPAECSSTAAANGGPIEGSIRVVVPKHAGCSVGQLHQLLWCPAEIAPGTLQIWLVPDLRVASRVVELACSRPIASQGGPHSASSC